MNILAIDPASAKKQGVAEYGPSGYSVASIGLDELELAIDAFARHTKGKGRVLLEGGYVGINPLTAMKLERVRGRIEQMTLAAKLTLETVPPSTWQKSMLRQGKYIPKKRDEIARMCRIRAENLLPGQKLTDDECSALVICEWGVLNGNRD